MFDPNAYTCWDLTLSYDEAIAGFQIDQAKRLERDGWNATTLHFYSHAGTHMDAPLHFGLKGTIDAFPVNRFLCKAWLLDISIKQANQLLTVANLGKLEKDIQAGEGIIFRTGWSQKLSHSAYRDELPRISKELAEWCVERKLNLLAVEPPSVADVNNLPEVTEIHQILLGGDIIILEGLTGLRQIKQKSVWLMALPLKIKGGDGAPARVIAFEKNEPYSN